MIDKRMIQAQLNRVAHLTGYPRTTEGLRDLFDAFAALETDVQARELIDKWLDMPALDINQRPQAPTGYDIKRIARTILDVKRDEWHAPQWNGSILEQGWFFSDLSNRPDMIANYQRMRAASKFNHAREFARKLLIQLGDYMGQEL